MKRFIKYSGIFTALAAIMILSFSSCKDKGSLTENKITFDTIHVSSIYHLDHDSTRPSCNLKLSFVYPVEYEDKAILDSLQQIFILGFLDDDTYAYYTPQEAIKKYEKAYIENYKRDVSIFFNEKLEQEEPEKYFSYYETVKSEIKYNKNDILSFQVIQSNYKGGADSYQFYRNYSIDLQNGTLIAESDIFENGYEKELSTIFKQYLLKSNKVEDVAALENLGYFGIDEIFPNGNILLDDKGVTYTFNKGEYSAYKLDPINIFIPYEDISFLIRTDSPIK